MKYTVLWLPDVERELTEIWLASADRDEISDATSRIESLLRLRPIKEGESRDMNQRILFVAPLAVTYEVREADRLVQVTSIWRFKSR